MNRKKNKEEGKKCPPRKGCACCLQIDLFWTAVPLWGQLGTNYLEFDWFVPETGLQC